MPLTKANFILNINYTKTFFCNIKSESNVSCLTQIDLLERFKNQKLLS